MKFKFLDYPPQKSKSKSKLESKSKILIGATTRSKRSDCDKDFDGGRNCSVKNVDELYQSLSKSKSVSISKNMLP